MTLPASGTISMSQFSVEMGQASWYAASMSWINSNAKVASNSMSGHYGKAWYKKTNAGNCNNSYNGVVYNCNCGALNCWQCINCIAINCVNCDARNWLQANCNCACTYNCSLTTYSSDCNCNCDCQCGSSCFLAGSIVIMADGSLRKIEDVRVGEYVRGAFGEANIVLGKDNVLLGNRYVYKINGEHDTTDEHPHVSPDRKFYVLTPSAIMDEWGNDFAVILEDGTTEIWTNFGLGEARINKMTTGITLLKDTGPKTIDSILEYSLPPETPLYNLVLGGSHTYFVDGYAVTGWPREDDFDYDTWTQTRTLSKVDYQAKKGL